jgi:hypothetical protein
LLLLISTQASAYTYWNEIRHSALLPDESVTVRVENPFGGGIDNFLLYSAAAITAEPMMPILDGPSTLSATVPGPISVPLYYGFRMVSGDEIDLMPVFIPNGVSPTPDDLTQLAPDAIGDELFGYTNLDLVDCHVSFSDDRIYVALENAGGGFPVIQGLTFFGYLLGIADPALTDPDTVIAIMHTYEQAGIISPGLYKITGTGLGNLTKIGEVTIQEYPEANTLLLSCLRSDLLADPYFMSWYDPSDPVIGVAGFTQRITLLGGAAEADRSPGGRMYIREFSISPVLNNIPSLSNPIFGGAGATAYTSIGYLDTDANCPVIAEVAFDGGAPYPLYPQSLDYTSSVVYRSDEGIAPLADDSWTSALYRFSDNEADTVEYEEVVTGIWDEELSEAAEVLRTSVSPNPFNATAHIDIYLESRARMEIKIYDVQGSLVRTLFDDIAAAGPNRFAWNGLNNNGVAVSSGLYLCKITALRSCRVHKMFLVR